MSHNIYVTQVRQHAWANLTLFDACAGLTEEQLALSVPGTYGTIPATWTHIVATQRRYFAGFGGESPGAYFWEREPFVGFAELRERLIAADELLLRIGETVAPDTIVTSQWRGETSEMPAEVFQAQALIHGAEHRQQIKVALTQAGTQPPEIDMWTYLAMAHGDADE